MDVRPCSWSWSNDRQPCFHSSRGAEELIVKELTGDKSLTVYNLMFPTSKCYNIPRQTIYTPSCNIFL